MLGPIIGLAFGPLTLLVRVAGLLSAAQGLKCEAATAPGKQADCANKVVDPTPILALAILGGFAQNSFIGALRR